MSDLIRKRLTGKEEGFTLIELLVVIVILGILMAIAVPSYMGFRDRAQKSAASANVRSIIPSVEAYYQDFNTYTGVTDVILRAGGTVGTTTVEPYDGGIALSANVSSASATTYCISDKQGDYVAKVVGPAGATGAVAMSASKTNAEC